MSSSKNKEQLEQEQRKKEKENRELLKAKITEMTKPVIKQVDYLIDNHKVMQKMETHRKKEFKARLLDNRRIKKYINSIISVGVTEENVKREYRNFVIYNYGVYKKEEVKKVDEFIQSQIPHLNAIYVEETRNDSILGIWGDKYLQDYFNSKEVIELKDKYTDLILENKTQIDVYEQFKKKVFSMVTNDFNLYVYYVNTVERMNIGVDDSLGDFKKFKNELNQYVQFGQEPFEDFINYLYFNTEIKYTIPQLKERQAEMLKKAEEEKAERERQQELEKERLRKEELLRYQATQSIEVSEEDFLAQYDNELENNDRDLFGMNQDIDEQEDETRPNEESIEIEKETTVVKEVKPFVAFEVEHEEPIEPTETIILPTIDDVKNNSTLNEIDDEIVEESLETESESKLIKRRRRDGQSDVEPEIVENVPYLRPLMNYTREKIYTQYQSVYKTNDGTILDDIYDKNLNRYQDSKPIDSISLNEITMNFIDSEELEQNTLNNSVSLEQLLNEDESGNLNEVGNSSEESTELEDIDSDILVDNNKIVKDDSTFYEEEVQSNKTQVDNLVKEPLIDENKADLEQSVEDDGYDPKLVSSIEKMYMTKLEVGYSKNDYLVKDFLEQYVKLNGNLMHTVSHDDILSVSFDVDNDSYMISPFYMACKRPMKLYFDLTETIEADGSEIAVNTEFKIETEIMKMLNDYILNNDDIEQLLDKRSIKTTDLELITIYKQNNEDFKSNGCSVTKNLNSIEIMFESDSNQFGYLYYNNELLDVTKDLVLADFNSHSISQIISNITKNNHSLNETQLKFFTNYISNFYTDSKN